MKLHTWAIAICLTVVATTTMSMSDAQSCQNPAIQARGVSPAACVCVLAVADKHLDAADKQAILAYWKGEGAHFLVSLERKYGEDGAALKRFGRETLACGG